MPSVPKNLWKETLSTLNIPRLAWCLKAMLQTKFSPGLTEAVLCCLKLIVGLEDEKWLRHSNLEVRGKR